MKILLLADVYSSHTFKWATSLSKNNFDIYIFTLTNYDECKHLLYSNFPEIKIYFASKTFNKNDFFKISYLLNVYKLIKYIKFVKPDIVHAHYATSYGILGALTKFHPFIISVWGSDVYSFPTKSFIHKKILKFNLKKADIICSTSYDMKSETQKYTSKYINVIPFGVDVDQFNNNSIYFKKNNNEIIIGITKNLEPVYGIPFLLNAFKIVKNRIKNKEIKLLIVGGGSQMNYLKNLAKELNINENVIFTGTISYTKIHEYHNLFDIFTICSLQESFGVAAVEAMACQKPVVASNVGGLKEVVTENETGYLVNVSNEIEYAEALEKLILNENLRINMGIEGREKVLKLYDWTKNVKEMIYVYNNIIQKS